MQDHFGEIEIPAGKLWGPATQRALENLPGYTLPSGRGSSTHTAKDSNRQSLIIDRQSPATNERFSLRFLQNLIILKKACALANRDCKILSAKNATRIANACDNLLFNPQLISENFPLSIWQSAAGTSVNMNANEVIAHIANRSKGDRINPYDHVNLSQSTNDVFPSVARMTAAQIFASETFPKLMMLDKAIIECAKEFETIIKPGRTHLQDAVPISLGDEFFGYAEIIANNLEPLSLNFTRFQQLPIGGTAVGNQVNAPDGYVPAVMAHLNGPNFSQMFDSLGLGDIGPNPVAEGTRLADTSSGTDSILKDYLRITFQPVHDYFSAQANPDLLVALSGDLKTCAIGLQKICTDLRLMNSGPNTGLAEIVLPALQDGSSMMPGKVNPIIPEMVMMMVARIIGNDSEITWATNGADFELNPLAPLIYYSALQSLELLGIAAEYFAEKCIKGIQPNVEHMADLAKHSQANITILTPEQGYEQVYQTTDNRRQMTDDRQQMAEDR